MSSRRQLLGLTFLGLLSYWAMWPVCKTANGHPVAQQTPGHTTQLPSTPEPPGFEAPPPTVLSPGTAPPPVGLPPPQMPSTPEPPGFEAPPPTVLPPGHTPAAPLAVAPVPPAVALPPPVLASPNPPDPPVPVVAIRVRVAAVSAPKQEIVYRLCVHNTSLAAAHHVLVRNPLPANARFVRATPEPSALKPELQWFLGTLPPGCCREILLVLTPTDDNDVKNCARVQFEHGQCVTTRIVRSIPIPGMELPMLPPGEAKQPPPVKQPLEKQPPEKQPPEKQPPEKLPKGEKKPPEPRLKLTMTGPKRQYANLPAKYRITVSNPGNAPATNVLIANPVPAGMNLVSSSSGSRFHGGQVAWQLGTLEAGANRTVEITLKAKEAGEICNKATALADKGLKAEAEFCTRFEGVSALTVEVKDTKDPLAVGDQTVYVIKVMNQGTAAVTNLHVSALVPPEMKLLEAKGASTPPPPDKLPKVTAEGQSVPFAPLQTLAPGATAQYRIYVQARHAGDVRFKVEVTADQLQADRPVLEEESTHVFAPEESKGP